MSRHTVSAARASDLKAFLAVLGPDGIEIVSSGDKVADATTRQKFIAAYDAKHQIVMEGDNKAVMVIGQEEFPLPIPLVRRKGMWRFDTVAGRAEILARRIGKNDGWCEDPRARNYNRPVKLSAQSGTDRLWREDHLYDLIVELDHNTRPRVPYRGSAVFIHFARIGFTPTAGCVALKRGHLQKLLPLLARDCWVEIR